MKAIVYLLAAILLPLSLVSQVNDNCINAIPLCSNPSFTFFSNSGPGTVVDFSVPAQSNISNPSPNPNPPNSGCLLSGELNPQWLLITVGNAGLLEFVFGAGNSAHPQVGLYDWIMWPYSPTTCAGIFNNTLPPIRCNWNGSGSGGTGMASPANVTNLGGSPSNFEAPLQVNACQQFIICISNYSGVNSLVSFQSIGTASLSCNPNCNPNYVICAGASASIVPVNFASLTNPSYSLQPGGLSNITGTFVVSPTVTTSYTTFITGINANNAVQTITSVSTVTVNPQPSSAPTTTQTSCSSTVSAFNLGLSFTPASSPGYTVTWSPTPLGITNNTMLSVSGSITPGAYNATITSTGGCQTTSSFVIQGPPSVPDFAFLPPGPVFTVNCYNPTLTVNASIANYIYNWSNGTVAPISGSVASFDNQKLGTWTVTATDPNSNCSSTKTILVVPDFTAPTTTLSTTYWLITCSTSIPPTLTVSATPSINIEHQFYWGTGGNVTGILSYSAIIIPGPGTHTHTAVNLVNGCSTSKTFTVATAAGIPTFSLTSPIQNYSIGCVPKHTVDVNITGAQSTPNPATGVTYTFLSTSSPTNYGTNLVSSTTFSLPGTYTAVVRDNLSNCEARVPFTILQNTFSPHLVVSIPIPTLSCYNPSVILTGFSNNASTGYQWVYPSGSGTLVTPGSTFSVQSTAITSNTLTGTYTFVVTDNNNACKSFSAIPIYQNKFAPQAKIAPPTGLTFGELTCNTPTITLTNASSSGVPGAIFPSPQGIAAILWTGPSPQMPLDKSTTYVASTPGTYTLLAQDLNNGCTSTTVLPVVDSKDYPVVNNPTVAPTATLDCSPNPNNTATVTALVSSTVPLKYVWSNSLGEIKTATLAANAGTAFALVNKPGDYRITVTNEKNGCVTISYGKVVLGDLTAAFSSDKESGFAPLTVTFNNNSSSSLNAFSITSVWSFGNSYTATTTSSVLTVSTIYNQPGNYTVTLFTSKGPCIDTAYKVINVELPSKLEIPNVFTPNGDGTNDLFFLRIANLTQLKASIYDRWGNLVYEVESKTGNIEWDGKNQYGKDVAEGTYFYIITATGKDEKSYDTKGTVNLYR